MRGQWVPHDTRDQVIDFVRRWSERSEMVTGRFIRWLGVGSSKFYDWQSRYGRVPFPLPEGLDFHRESNPAWCSTRHTLAGLTATTSASSIMKVSRR